MDEKITAVLAAYHERMREERELRRIALEQGDDDWRDRSLLAVGPPMAIEAGLEIHVTFEVALAASRHVPPAKLPFERMLR